MAGAKQLTPDRPTGVIRPDARNIFDNAGQSRGDPYQGRYPWAVPPPGAVPINRITSIPAPANGAQVLVAEFDVPQAMEAVITMVLNVYAGSGPFVDGSGTITWVIDINNPLGASTGYSPPDFQKIQTTRGSFANGPWPVAGGIRLYERDQIRYKVTTTAPIGVALPNVITCGFIGWYWPTYPWAR